MFFLLLEVIVLNSNHLASQPPSDKHISLSKDETIILEQFFDILVRLSEGGYVLFGKKPICINGFRTVDSFSIANDTHKESVYLREGAAIWKKISDGNFSNFLIHVYDNCDSLVDNCIHILFINKQLFYQTVEKNLSLFQYVLGPDLTPESLLEKLTNSHETFHNVLKNDKVLIGILLGFGTQNSLLVSRIENIQEAFLSSAENFPLGNRCQNSQSFINSYKDIFLHNAHRETRKIPLEPSFSYSTFEEEISEATNKIDVSSKKLSELRPYFIFARLKNDVESEQLIIELEKT